MCLDGRLRKERLNSFLNHFRSQGQVSARQDDDCVLTSVCSDHDAGCTCAAIGIACQMYIVDSFIGKRRIKVVSECISADTSNQKDMCVQSCCGNSLVKPFPSKKSGEIVTNDRL